MSELRIGTVALQRSPSAFVWVSKMSDYVGMQLRLSTTVLVQPTRCAVPIKDGSPKERWGSRSRLSLRTRLLQEAHAYAQ